MKLPSWLTSFFHRAEQRAGESVADQEMGSGWRYAVKHYVEQVSPMLYRGSRPDGREEDWKRIYGLRSVVNLCVEPTGESWPPGVHYEQIPCVDNEPPIDQHVRDFLRVVDAYGPCLVHCEAGQGRTGVMVACYRMARQGWGREAAVADAIAHGMKLQSQIEFLRRWTP